jgi:glycosyltransferase involved in cell wall biosynthesis
MAEENVGFLIFASLRTEPDLQNNELSRIALLPKGGCKQLAAHDNEPMNILLITNRYPRDDNDPASPFVPDFVQALTALGARVIVSTPQYGDPPETENGDVYRFRFGPTTDETPIGSWNILLPKTWLKIHRFVAVGERAVDDLVTRFSIDHILALWALPSGWFARHVARKRDIPYSVWCLGSDINSWARRPIFGRITRHILSKADHVFADGFALAKAARKLAGRPCRFLPSFCFLPDDRPVTGERIAKRPFFLYAGRMHRDKGVYDLLAAYNQANLAARGFDLIFVGDGPEMERIRLLVQDNKTSEHVKVLGRVPGTTLTKYYRGAQAVVIPSRADSLPLVFSEAVQCGSPVVVYDTGDLGHFVRRFKLGRVVAAGDVQSLGQALIDFSVGGKKDVPGAQAVLSLLDPARAARKFLQAVRGSNAESMGLKTKAVKRETLGTRMS